MQEEARGEEKAIRPRLADAEAYQVRGNADADRGDWDDAIADYTQALRLNPNNMLYCFEPMVVSEAKG